MKKLLINSGLFACLVAVIVSVWIAANPVAVKASGATATCWDGTEVWCEVAGASCYAHDGDANENGYCICTQDGHQVQFDDCMFYMFLN